MTQYHELDITETASNENRNGNEDRDLFLPGDIITFTGPGEHDVTTREITQELTFVEILTKQGISVTEMRAGPIAITKILRPIPALPTVPGYYSYGNLELSDGVAAYRLHTDGDWSLDGQKVPKQEMRKITPLVRLAPETEASPVKLSEQIDAEKLADHLIRVQSSITTYPAITADALITAIDNGELDK